MKVYAMSSKAGDFLAVEHDGARIDMTRAMEIRSGADQSGWHRVDRLSRLFSLSADPIRLLKETLDFAQSHGMMDRLNVPKAARLQAPIRRPPKFIGLGLNYKARPGAPPSPFKADGPVLFTKPSSSVIGPGERILLPEDMGTIIHEAELAVVIGRECRNVDAQYAQDYIFGYCVHNDVTAMDTLMEDYPTVGSWARAKFCDTFSPIGPCILTADEIDPRAELDVICRVNEEVRQQGNTREMVMAVPEIIEMISRRATLEPGDIIGTGSPAGAGPLVSGDIVECEIPEIGILSNHAIGESFDSRADMVSEHDGL